ncbi:MAG: hypothetical protein LBJ67_10820 [Planctomycetaceae bacterium]|nr:hypothetical protein [Planctomycetaceae bacterium]
MKSIVLRKICFGVGAFFIGMFLIVLFCSRECSGADRVCQDNEKRLQSDLQKQLSKRSEQYLISIENNPSFSPEMKSRLRLQAQSVIKSGLTKLSNLSTVRRDSPKLASEPINTAFIANALNKIENSNAVKNSPVIKFDSSGIFRAFEFLRGHFAGGARVYLPTVCEVRLCVALSGDISAAGRARGLLRGGASVKALLCQFMFGAIGCGEIIATMSRSGDTRLLSFAKLLARDIKSVAAAECQDAVCPKTSNQNENVTATALLVAETIILRN